jgi:hypothetical protein
MNVMLSFDHVVCQRDDACIRFPPAGGISSLDIEDEDIADMTSEKLYSNQMCNVTSECLLHDV